MRNFPGMITACVVTGGIAGIVPGMAGVDGQGLDSGIHAENRAAAGVAVTHMAHLQRIKGCGRTGTLGIFLRSIATTGRLLSQSQVAYLGAIQPEAEHTILAAQLIGMVLGYVKVSACQHTVVIINIGNLVVSIVRLHYCAIVSSKAYLLAQHQITGGVDVYKTGIGIGTMIAEYSAEGSRTLALCYDLKGPVLTGIQSHGLRQLVDLLIAYPFTIGNGEVLVDILGRHQLQGILAIGGSCAVLREVPRISGEAGGHSLIVAVTADGTGLQSAAGGGTGRCGSSGHISVALGGGYHFGQLGFACFLDIMLAAGAAGIIFHIAGLGTGCRHCLGLGHGAVTGSRQDPAACCDLFYAVFISIELAAGRGTAPVFAVAGLSTAGGNCFHMGHHMVAALNGNDLGLGGTTDGTGASQSTFLLGGCLFGDYTVVPGMLGGDSSGHMTASIITAVITDSGVAVAGIDRHGLDITGNTVQQDAAVGAAAHVLERNAAVIVDRFRGGFKFIVEAFGNGQVTDLLTVQPVAEDAVNAAQLVGMVLLQCEVCGHIGLEVFIRNPEIRIVLRSANRRLRHQTQSAVFFQADRHSTADALAGCQQVHVVGGIGTHGDLKDPVLCCTQGDALIQLQSGLGQTHDTVFQGHRTIGKSISIVIGGSQRQGASAVGGSCAAFGEIPGIAGEAGGHSLIVAVATDGTGLQSATGSGTGSCGSGGHISVTLGGGYHFGQLGFACFLGIMLAAVAAGIIFHIAGLGAGCRHCLGLGHGTVTGSRQDPAVCCDLFYAVFISIELAAGRGTAPVFAVAGLSTAGSNCLHMGHHMVAAGCFENLCSDNRTTDGASIRLLALFTDTGGHSNGTLVLSVLSRDRSGLSTACVVTSLVAGTGIGMAGVNGQGLDSCDQTIGSGAACTVANTHVVHGNGIEIEVGTLVVLAFTGKLQCVSISAGATFRNCQIADLLAIQPVAEYTILAAQLIGVVFGHIKVVAVQYALFVISVGYFIVIVVAAAFIHHSAVRNQGCGILADGQIAHSVNVDEAAASQFSGIAENRTHLLTIALGNDLDGPVFGGIQRNRFGHLIDDLFGIQNAAGNRNGFRLIGFAGSIPCGQRIAAVGGSGAVLREIPDVAGQTGNDVLIIAAAAVGALLQGAAGSGTGSIHRSGGKLAVTLGSDHPAVFIDPGVACFVSIEQAAVAASVVGRVACCGTGGFHSFGFGHAVFDSGLNPAVFLDGIHTVLVREILAALGAAPVFAVAVLGAGRCLGCHMGHLMVAAGCFENLCSDNRTTDGASIRLLALFTDTGGHSNGTLVLSVLSRDRSGLFTALVITGFVTVTGVAVAGIETQILNSSLQALGGLITTGATAHLDNLET